MKCIKWKVEILSWKNGKLLHKVPDQFIDQFDFLDHIVGIIDEQLIGEIYSEHKRQNRGLEQ